jgi:hypothetical protein
MSTISFVSIDAPKLKPEHLTSIGIIKWLKQRDEYVMKVAAVPSAVPMPVSDAVGYDQCELWLDLGDLTDKSDKSILSLLKKMAKVPSTQMTIDEVFTVEEMKDFDHAEFEPEARVRFLRLNVQKLIKTHNLKSQAESPKGRKQIQEMVGKIVDIPNVVGHVARWHKLNLGPMKEEEYYAALLKLMIDHKEFKLAAKEVKEQKGGDSKKYEPKKEINKIPNSGYD